MTPSNLKLALPNLTTAPPGGWRYLVPETNQLFADSNLEALQQALKAHYRATGYDVPADLMTRIEAYLCAEVPEYCGAGPSAVQQQPKSGDGSFTFHHVVRGMTVLIGWVAGGGERASAALAEQRAATCAPCPLNVKPQGCSGCNMTILRQLAEKIVGSKRTANYDKLHACKVCSCQLNAKIWLPHKNLWPKMSDAQKSKLPGGCWLKTEVEA